MLVPKRLVPVSLRLFLQRLLSTINQNFNCKTYLTLPRHIPFLLSTPVQRYEEMCTRIAICNRQSGIRHLSCCCCYTRTIVSYCSLLCSIKIQLLGRVDIETLHDSAHVMIVRRYEKELLTTSRLSMTVT